MKDIMMVRREERGQLAVQFSINALWEFIKYHHLTPALWVVQLGRLASVKTIVIDEPTTTTSDITTGMSPG